MGAKSARTCLASFFLRLRQGWWSPLKVWASSTHCKSASLDSWFSGVTVTLWMLPEAPWLPGIVYFCRNMSRKCVPSEWACSCLQQQPCMQLYYSPHFSIYCSLFPCDNVLHGENRGSWEWSQLLVLAVKVNCMLYVLSKFFVLWWQLYRKSGMLEGCSQKQGWENVAVLHSGCCFFPMKRVSFCSGHCAWLPGLHPPFCDGSPSISPSGPTPPHDNTSLTIIFSLLWPWVFRGVM